MSDSKFVTCEELEKQNTFIQNIKELNSLKKCPTACVITYGCQQNENDSERLKGMLEAMGYSMTENRETADVVIFNTCAVRENAEMKLRGNVGALKSLKRKRKDMIIAVCGCMVQQEKEAEILNKKFKHIDLIFGTHSLYRFPELLYKSLSERIIDVVDIPGRIAEGIPVSHDDKFKAWVSVMYGCNNFCSYCVVPYVRGRERSRKHEDVINEIKTLAENGYVEVTLLGQNVNSYGNDSENEISFAELLNEVCKIDGIKRVRFATSHPKDISDELIDVMAANSKICPQLHLPFQSGSNKVLKDMNRGYTREKYLDTIRKVKEKIPNIALSSDVIVGFPTESNDDFEETISLLKEVEYDSLFTFIYSKRRGTVAAKIEPVLTADEVEKNFNKLLETQNEISKRKNEAFVGKIIEVFVEGRSKNNDLFLQGRTPENKIVNFSGPDTLIGKLINVKITDAKTWSLDGEIA